MFALFDCSGVRGDAEAAELKNEATDLVCIAAGGWRRAFLRVCGVISTRREALDGIRRIRTNDGAHNLQ